MKILVDTSIWSLALRRKSKLDDPDVVELEKLVKEFRAQLIGPIRQELLSGIRSHPQFQRLRNSLAAFPDFPLQTDDYELAAEFFNLGRRKGVQGSNTDYLICAVSRRNDMPIFTTDNDFLLLQRILPIELHSVASPG